MRWARSKGCPSTPWSPGPRAPRPRREHWLRRARLLERGAPGRARLMREKRRSRVELITTYLERIERLDERLRAFITVCGESALVEAKRAESEAARGKWRGPLHGIPFAVKDQLDTAGILTTSGSALLRGH